MIQAVGVSVMISFSIKTFTASSNEVPATSAGMEAADAVPAYLRQMPPSFY
jgi:hypothetical protein